MKRFLILTLALCMMLSLTGCIKKTDSAGSGSVGQKLYEGTLDSEFSALMLDIDVGDVTIEPGDGFRVEYGLWHDPVIEEDSGVLTIREKAESLWWQSFSFGSGKQAYVKVTVPAGTLLERLNVLCDVGDVKLDSADVGALDISTDVGDVTVSSTAVSGAAAFDTDVGNIECRTLIVGGALKLDTDTGEIRFDGSAASVEADADVGSVALKLSGAAADWSMTLDTDTGSVKVDGLDQGKRFESAGGDRILTANVDVGDVEVEFEG